MGLFKLGRYLRNGGIQKLIISFIVLLSLLSWIHHVYKPFRLLDYGTIGKGRPLKPSFFEPPLVAPVGVPRTTMATMGRSIAKTNLSNGQLWNDRLWDEHCELAIFGDDPKEHETISPSTNSVSIIDYKKADADLDLHSVHCRRVKNTPLYERVEFEFEYICPNDYSVHKSEEVAHALLERSALRQIFEYAKRYPSLIVLDIGANIGALTIPLARAIPNARIVAIEPVLSNLRSLTKAIMLNGVQDRVVLLHNAMYNQSGKKLRMLSYLDGNKSILSWSRISEISEPIPRNWNAENDVLSVTFAALVPFVRPFQRCVIKIDVEGAECVALQTVQSLFELDHLHIPMIVIETDKLDKVDEMCVENAFAMLLANGYEPISDQYSVSNQRVISGKLNPKEYKSWKHINTIWIKRCPDGDS